MSAIKRVLEEIQEGLEARADADHAAHVGKVILATVVTGYAGNDCVDVRCDPPARVRVSKTRTQDIRHWNDEWLDPYWDVQLVEPHPALEGVDSLWVFGPSYCTLEGQKESPIEWTVEETSVMQRVKDFLRGTK